MPNHALVIGIDRYGTDLESLNGAVADAQAFASWLVTSGQVPPANLRLGLLPTASSPPAPDLLSNCQRVGTTLDALDALLLDWLDAPPNEVERFYFFFSGHGASSSNPLYAEEAICLEGFTGGKWRHSLQVSSLEAVLNAIAAKERIILIDGCRNAAASDDIRFGILGRQPRPAPGRRCNFVLRATGPGRKAVALAGHGLFGRHLVEGLHGAGGAKLWDPEARSGEGGYLVRWSTLGPHVSALVAGEVPAQRHEQLIYEGGEHPVSEDPILAIFPALHFGKSKLTVRLVDPPDPPQPVQIVLRRNESAEEDLCEEVPTSGQVEFEIPPSAWRLWARADGWRSNPRSRTVRVYSECVETQISLVPDMPLVLSAPEFQAGLLEAKSDLCFSPMLHSDVAEYSIHPRKENESRLRFTVAGVPLQHIVPALRVGVRRESGSVVNDPVVEDELALSPGMYRVRLDVAGGGAWSETSVLISNWERQTVDLALPDTTTLALERTLAAGGKPMPDAGLSIPSERAGPLAGTTVATVAAFAVAEAIQAGQDSGPGLSALGLGERWGLAETEGVEVLIADESPESDEVERDHPNARFWRMQASRTRPATGDLAPSHSGAPIASASVMLSTGGYWLQLRDSDRKRRAGMKLATVVLPGHVTLVVRHRQTNGAVLLMQFAVPRDALRLRQIQLGLAQGEVLQRARAGGRDPIADPGIRLLAQGKWFEPLSALIAAAALLNRGDDARELFEQVLAELTKHDVWTSDLAVLQAARAARAGEHEVAEQLIRKALATGQAPVVDLLLERLETEARNLDGGENEQALWITEKLGQTVGHPLWTLRREDDARRSGKPDAV